MSAAVLELGSAPAVRAAEAPPSEMQTARRWLHYALEERRKPDGSPHWAKVPYYVDGDRRRGDLGQDAGRLVSYSEACALLPLYGASRAGLGFALGDGWQGVDFDKCDERPELAALIHSLPGYVELSPSARGVHAIGRGVAFATLGSNASGIEAYCELRFFTFTGWSVRPGQQLADLAPFVAQVLAPRHAAHRKSFIAQPMPANVSTGDREVDEIIDALRYLDPDDRDTWIRIGQALYTMGEKGRGIWSAWSATSQRFPGGDDLERWETFSGTRTSWQSVFKQAQAAGWVNPRKRDAAKIFAGSSLVAVPGGVAANAPAMPMPMPTGIPPARRLDAGPVMPDELIDRSNPMRTARVINAAKFTVDGQRTIQYQSGQFFVHGGASYAAMPVDDFKGVAYRFLEGARDQHGAPFKPTQTVVNQVVDAAKGIANVAASLRPPCWLDDRTTPDASQLVACSNGLLDLTSRTLHPTTPAFFSLNAVPFAFDPKAPEPMAWHRFLADLWPDDPLAIQTLQEMFGYLLTGDTSQQKIFLIVGPKRSGKGTIARLITSLLGQANVAGPTLSGLSQPFGLESLIGKLAAIISDARLGARTDQHATAERLLSISGEDSLSVPVKHRQDWTGRLNTRFVILTNELPRIADSSGALASRFVILSMSNSFIGREDPGLTSRLLDDLPGILNWAIDGYDRLKARGYFVPPPSSADAAQELADLSSPIAAFVRDCCDISAAADVECSVLFAAWRAWCIRQGRDHAGSMPSFGRDLRAAVTGVNVAQVRVGGAPRRFYRGVRLLTVTPCHA